MNELEQLRARCAELEAKNAALWMEVIRWKELADIGLEQDKRIVRMDKLIDELRQQLAASQARELQLREACACADWNSLDLPEFTRGKLAAALALPSDTAALEALIAKAGEVMRERAAVEAYEWTMAYVMEDSAPFACADVVRALPAVTLEDVVVDNVDAPVNNAENQPSE